MIALEQRREQDNRTLGEIFFYLTDELADITFYESYMILLKAMFESIYTIFNVTEAQLEELINMFVGKLPSYIQNALAKGNIAA